MTPLYYVVPELPGYKLIPPTMPLPPSQCYDPRMYLHHPSMCPYAYPPQPNYPDMYPMQRYVHPPPPTPASRMLKETHRRTSLKKTFTSDGLETADECTLCEPRPSLRRTCEYEFMPTSIFWNNCETPTVRKMLKFWRRRVKRCECEEPGSPFYPPIHNTSSTPIYNTSIPTYSTSFASGFGTAYRTFNPDCQPCDPDCQPCNPDCQPFNPDCRPFNPYYQPCDATPDGDPYRTFVYNCDSRGRSLTRRPLEASEEV